jgi:hypothetical protein
MKKMKMAINERDQKFPQLGGHGTIGKMAE